jgi:hypothetical protein
MAHLPHIGIYRWPVEAQLDAMQSPICVHMSPNRVGMECHKDDVGELTRDQLEMHVRIAPHNGFLQNEHPILNTHKQFL